MDIKKLINSPIRVQILQYLAENGAATTKQLSKALPEIASPTLYRHIGAMLDDGILLIKEERKVRGSLERLLCINKDEMESASQGDISMAAYPFLMGLYSRFERYAALPDQNPKRDMLLLRTSTIRLSDDDYTEFLTELGVVLQRYLHKSDDSKEKLRSITFISAPVIEEDDN